VSGAGWLAILFDELLVFNSWPLARLRRNFTPAWGPADASRSYAPAAILVLVRPPSMFQVHC